MRGMMASTDPHKLLAAKQPLVLQLRNRKVNRQTVVSPGACPTADEGVSTDKRENNATVGIFAALQPTQQSDESSPGRLGQSGEIPARQGKAALWSDLEIQELKRLVPENTDPKGKVSWVRVEEAWRQLNLPPRTKAGLSSRWTGLKSRTPTLLTNGDSAPTRGKAKLKTSA